MRSVPSPAAQEPPVILPLEFNLSIRSSADSFLKDGREIRVGDCALFQAGNAPPFIGIIRWFTTSKEDCLKLCVNWLYRPADVKLAKDILLEAAPNEVFYSFHKDVISSSSLLHPCKVAFLGKGVELPLGISSFICRRVYDIANKCLWWLTDQDFINERQEEVDQLLYKTRLEMHAGVQSGDRSPKPLNGSSSIPQINSGTDSVENSGTSFPAQVRGKKRNKGGDQGTEPIKRGRPTKLEDGESASSRLDNMIKAEIAKFREKGALITTDSVEKLVHLIQLDRNERKIDFAGRILLADLITATDKIECLARFVQLRGVPVLDDWLQEARKGKSGDGCSPKDTDKVTEELLLALLRALDKLPVNLNALRTCNIGKSVNHLRGHKNIEVQKKAKSLVETWKKRVDAEMTKINDEKSVGSNQAVTWPVKTPINQISTCKTLVGKPGHADTLVKLAPVTPGLLKLPSTFPASVSISPKDSPGKGTGSSENSELLLAGVKEEKSSGSSQSFSDHAKAMNSSWKEDARSSTAGSMNANLTSGGSSRHPRSSISEAQKEGNLGKTGSLNHRLIVRLPNPGRSPTQSASGGSLEDPSVPGSGASSPGPPDKYEHIDRKIKPNAESWQSNDVKESVAGHIIDASRAVCLSPVNGKGVSLTETKSGNSLSSMNALIVSCTKYSEASASLSSGDDVGINLLANVATGEISKSDLASPCASPGSLPENEPCAASDEDKSRLTCEDGELPQPPVTENHADSSNEIVGAAIPSSNDGEAKLDFDLNEGFSGDEHDTSPAPVYSPAGAKGSFMPPESVMKRKGEHGWKGSAATSAFRPAEPRRASLDIDLNVCDERVVEDMASGRSYGGLDLDLNKVDEGTDMFRDFDLNSGPGVNEVGVETPFLPQIYRGTAMAFPSYAGFPFGSTCPITSTYFPGIPSTFARPYMGRLEEGRANMVSENSRECGRHGLDLNAGPGSADAQAFMDYQMSGIKRKEREGGSWDERFYKQPSWQ